MVLEESTASFRCFLKKMSRSFLRVNIMQFWQQVDLLAGSLELAEGLITDRAGAPGDIVEQGRQEGLCGEPDQIVSAVGCRTKDRVVRVQ